MRGRMSYEMYWLPFVWVERRQERTIYIFVLHKLALGKRNW